MRKFIPIVVIWAAVLLAYFPTFSVYFSGDDFFMFKVSLTNGSLGEFIKLLGIYPFAERGLAFYRPLFREILHNIYFNFFGLNHIPFRILLMGVHFINISLVYFLIQNIFKKSFLSFFVALFFGISSANVATLYYIPGGIESSGATAFALLTLIFYIKFLETGKQKIRLLSLIFFGLALASHEIVMATPLVLAAYVIIFSSKKTKLKNLLQLWPLFLMVAALLYIDIFQIGLSSAEEQYRAVFDPKKILHSFSWYALWALGLPEMLIDFVLPGFKLNPALMRYWGNYYIVIFISAVLSFLILSTKTFILFFRKRGVLKKELVFTAIWFIVAISPVILLPAHKSGHYLIFALTGFWSFIALIAFNFPKKATIFLIILLITLQITSIKLGEKTHWAATRGKTAQKLISELKSAYPSLPKGSAIYFTNDPTYPYLTKEWGGTSKQASLILNNSDALQLLYKDPTLQVFYEDLGGVAKDFPQDKIYSIMARTNWVF
ncbi:MAG: hypothetical protein Q8Q91_00070 [Candidatus Daviesbacteria bacterium]|nr:hypothetical protein [Candidatus Daviesbacteria bacterium]